MNSLSIYAEKFSESFPKYSDPIYQSIVQLIERLDEPNIINVLQSKEFTSAIQLIEPLIVIKNYKSQIPFPTDIGSVIECMVRIRGTEVDSVNKLKNHGNFIEKLLLIEGFQLPTVSAILHFCHPFEFPIVDINVATACKFLKGKYKLEFENVVAPTLPQFGSSPKNKLKKYSDFINFISRIAQLQLLLKEKLSYREIDKALMVLGSELIQSKQVVRSQN